MMARQRKMGFDVIDGGQANERGDPFGLADYLQMAGFGKRSVIVSVDEDEASGEVTIRSGEVWAARDAEGEGEEALRRLLQRTLTQTVPVRCRPFTAGSVPRNIRCSLESMMLETARRWDEDTRDLKPKRAPAPTTSQNNHFEALFDEGVDALLRKDYAEAYAAFRAADQIRPGDRLVTANLQRLASLGVGEDSDGSND